MTSAFVRRGTLAALALLATTGCLDLFGPSQTLVEEDELTFITVAPEAPPLEAMEVSFWAKKGEDREVQIRYVYPNGTTGKCLRFIVPSAALLRHSNGQAIQQGDSVEISIRVLDPQRFMFEFNPRGLDFDPQHPARIEVHYLYASLDLDGDGIEGDPDDFGLMSRMGLWKQERGGEPWQEVASRRDESRKELYADIDGFTRYALAAD